MNALIDEAQFNRAYRLIIGREQTKFDRNSFTSIPMNKGKKDYCEDETNQPLYVTLFHAIQSINDLWCDSPDLSRFYGNLNEIQSLAALMLVQVDHPYESDTHLPVIGWDFTDQEV